MITAIIIAIVFAFATLICYAAVYVGAEAEIREKRYWEEHKNELHGQNNT